jgi:transposase
MQVVYQSCCGIDVHKKMVVACLLTVNEAGELKKDIRTYSTMTVDLLKLLDWLLTHGCTHVAMESTGVYWKPLFNLMEGQLEVLVVNAHHLKAVPGRKTDVKDAQWIAELLQHGLVRASFIPPAPQREVRELTRYRSSLVEERARTINRLQKVLEDANLKLASVVTDVLGVSGKAILQALLAGEEQADKLADLGRGRLRNKREQLEQALTGQFKEHHRFMLMQHLSHIDYLDELVEQLNAEIEKRLASLAKELELLDQITGVNQRIAEIVLSEIGSDLSRFPTDKHLTSWAGICPGNYESAGKRLSGKIRKGNKRLRQALIEAAHGAARSKDTFLGELYRRLARRIGKYRAMVAVAHRILVIIYHILTKGEAFKELGAGYHDEKSRERVERGLVRRLEKLGYEVVLKPTQTESRAS